MSIGQGEQDDINFAPLIHYDPYVAKEISNLVGSWHELVSGSVANTLMLVNSRLESAAKICQPKTAEEKRIWGEATLGAMLNHAKYFAELRVGYAGDPEEKIAHSTPPVRETNAR